MKLTTALCIATSVMCARLCAGEISGDQLRDAFISYVGKAEKTTPDAATLAKMREELAKAKTDPLLQAFRFEGEKLDREMLMDQIAKGLEAWKAAGIPLNKGAEFASARGNLKALSDAELVMALRLVDQVVSRRKSDK